MATTDRWAQPQVVREQLTLFQPTLDDMIPQDHEVRLLDETLRTLDWSPWEAKYKRGGAGQPPIHPRVLAGIWLYAMMRRIRTSRPLEYACGHNVDFMWLAEGRTPDHSTLATFFSKNQEPLKDLFKQVCRMAMTLGMVRLGEVGFDATRTHGVFIVDPFRMSAPITISTRMEIISHWLRQSGEQSVRDAHDAVDREEAGGHRRADRGHRRSHRHRSGSRGHGGSRC